MQSRSYQLVSGIVFGLVALLHLVRAVAGWQVQVEGVGVPLWLSWLGLVGGGALSVWAFRLAAR